MSGKLRVLFDTTVFCGALVKPDGGNMKCLLLANGPFFHPVVSQAVLAECVHSATIRGLGTGARRRFLPIRGSLGFSQGVKPFAGQRRARRTPGRPSRLAALALSLH